MTDKKWIIRIFFATCFLAIITAQPLGEFALNDDWFYYRAVNNFSWTAKFDPLITPALIGQVWYGSALTNIFGFSFSLLRLSTILLALIALVFFIKLLVERGVALAGAVMAGAVLFFNPLFFNLSFTFMTDIPALSLATIGLYYLHRFVQTRRISDFTIAQILFIYTCLIRQNYFTLLVFSGLVIWGSPKKLRLWSQYIGGLAVAAGLLIFLQGRGWWPLAAVDMHSFDSAAKLVTNAGKQMYFIINYLALFLAPLIIGWWWQADKKIKITSALAGLAGVGLSIWMWAQFNFIFPFFKNIINIYGLGAKGKNLVLTGAPAILIQPWLALVLTLIIGYLVGVLVTILVIENPIGRALSWQKKLTAQASWHWFLLLNFGAQAGVIMTLISFDRYYLPLLLFILIFLTPALPARAFNYANGALVVIIAILVVATTHDYLAENRLRWQIADNLKNNLISAQTIDAGYEWLGWNVYRGESSGIPNQRISGVPWYIVQLFPNNTRQWVVSYSENLAGYFTRQAYGYSCFLRKSCNLYLLERATPAVNAR